jgi:hypothetical protein
MRRGDRAETAVNLTKDRPVSSGFLVITNTS